MSRASHRRGDDGRMNAAASCHGRCVDGAGVTTTANDGRGDVQARKKNGDDMPITKDLPAKPVVQTAEYGQSRGSSLESHKSAMGKPHVGAS
ncbi:unnamed protein product [Nippostrongylus brasiliensis]|uniref:DUF4148 domain-containing protein n=1 Tax=Nippostrongylus brasiliensis TaxID=27835 RepID=A0A0N4XTQ1_NIPBR|nr:unnamed protein product [Nippostrongylus brasiliensis]